MMSMITHNCYISNQHSEPDLEGGGEWNLRWNVETNQTCDELAWGGGTTVGLWPSKEKCVDTVFQLLDSKRKKESVNELAPQIWVHELKASCSTLRQKTPGPFNLLRKPKATKDQVEYMERKKNKKIQSNKHVKGEQNNKRNKRNRTRHKIVCKIIELYRIGPGSPGRVG